jgi:hypothetical protein
MDLYPKKGVLESGLVFAITMEPVKKNRTG